MILRLEHIGIAVKSLEDSNAHFEKLLALHLIKRKKWFLSTSKLLFYKRGRQK